MSKLAIATLEIHCFSSSRSSAITNDRSFDLGYNSEDSASLIDCEKERTPVAARYSSGHLQIHKIRTSHHLPQRNRCSIPKDLQTGLSTTSIARCITGIMEVEIGGV